MENVKSLLEWSAVFTIVYILIVNSLILSEAGIPINGAVIATILLSALSCVMIGLWANVPILLVPGMGINALFAIPWFKEWVYHGNRLLVLCLSQG
ncbi:hypothetical protein RCO48_34890 [Peribacillus frigoritolerans]|nr:hypothetical protein [Peribacillus frigoritolerans]